MKKKPEDLHQKKISELKPLLAQKRKELVKSKFDLELKKLKNIHKIKSIRKEIARILTIAREKKLIEKGNA